MFVVTGGGSGIGSALAKELARQGQDVLIVGRRLEPLENTAAFSDRISFLVADISLMCDRDLIKERLSQVNEIDGLIHNAGTIEPIQSIEKITVEDWQRALATNLDAPLFLTQLLFEKLKKARVLHVGSGAAYHPMSGWAAYCVSKAALSMLTRCWQLEFPDYAFASVMPGIVDTEMQSLIRKTGHMERKEQEFFQSLKKENKLLSADQVAEFLCWLLLRVDKKQYSAKEWDIYEKEHHPFWLKSPHTIPEIR
ncbi:sepiapterin reductase (plasmid) [Legionella adelaidensis]|uniref:Sepiapterin reductase n=1 Tax=Legionella adelaidensis TaxID=45056 RepID=A0A0W0R3N8_9GAMM|nr:SDR family NAD(P)-dependent oxidoreductase [Legionella adelaidensis]KTC65650.1 sepiapterin reductase [Legionella adelaidensis]VEH85154.1 sepiapterin reductase [Legionella adelaidensis]